MNFVDAIRTAGAQRTPNKELTQAILAPAPESAVHAMEASPTETVKTWLEEKSDGTSVVRLELHLSPEQTNALIRNALSSNHRYLTLREAAQYLRLKSSELTQLAASGVIPGFEIEGKWRFERTSLDQWAKAHTTTPTENIA